MNFNSPGTNPLLTLINFVNRGQITRNGSGVQTIPIPFTNEATGNVTVATGKKLTFSGTTVNNGNMVNNGTLINAGLMKGTGNFSGNITTSSSGTLSPGLSPG